jgi:hypothetical protein
LTGLRGSQDLDALFDLVHDHLACALSPQEAFQALQRLRLELGIDRAGAENRLQDNLEYAMEKTSYECPARGN